MVDDGNNDEGTNGRTTGKGSCAFSTDGAKCAVIGEDGAMRVFATGSGAMIWETGAAMPADAGVGAACWTSVIGQSVKQQVVRSLATRSREAEGREAECMREREREDLDDDNSRTTWSLKATSGVSSIFDPAILRLPVRPTQGHRSPGCNG